MDAVTSSTSHREVSYIQSCEDRECLSRYGFHRADKPTWMHRMDKETFSKPSKTLARASSGLHTPVMYGEERD